MTEVGRLTDTSTAAVKASTEPARMVSVHLQPCLYVATPLSPGNRLPRPSYERTVQARQDPAYREEDRQDRQDEHESPEHRSERRDEGRREVTATRQDMADCRDKEVRQPERRTTLAGQESI